MLAKASENDVILAQITSRSFHDSYAVNIDSDSLENGGLNVPSNIRTNKIFTVQDSIIIYKIGKLRAEVFSEVVNIIIDLLSE